MQHKHNVPTHINEIKKLLIQSNQISKKTNLKGSRILFSFMLASLVTGTNWYLQKILSKAQTLQQQSILTRVNNDTTIDCNRYLIIGRKITDFQHLNQIQGCKIKVTGQLQKGRIMIKRKRGNQDGYMIFAPFIVQRINNGLKNRFDFTLNIKYMLNLGWVPMESKHKIRSCAADDALQFDQQPEELYGVQDAPTPSTITAFVRKGEKKDAFRGYKNFVQDRLYKFIDLPFFEGVYNAVNPTFRYVYLDRADEKGQQSFPFPNTKQLYKQQIKEQINYIKKKHQNFTIYGGVAAFASAALLSLL